MSEPRHIWRWYRQYIQYPEGFVYFATFEEPRDVVKIGWSQNPWWRVIALGGYYGATMVLIDQIEIKRGSKYWGVAYGSLEYRIHRELARKRVHPWTLEFSDRGEWYSIPRSEVDRLIENVRRNIAREDAAQLAARGASNGPMSSSESKRESA